MEKILEMFGQHINECLLMEANKEEQLISRNSRGNDSWGGGQGWVTLLGKLLQG